MQGTIPTRRRLLIGNIARSIVALPFDGVVRVGIDGVDGAGKTYFRRELTEAVEALGRRAIGLSLDGFHNPKTIRYRLGRGSPEGFFLDTYDYASFRRFVVDPTEPGGNGVCRLSCFDLHADEPVAGPEIRVSLGTVLLVDGLFLHRPELAGIWQFSIVLRVPFETSVPRGASRGPEFGSPDPEALSNRRYVEGNRIYFARCEPECLATVVVDNVDLAEPWIAIDRRRT